VRVRLSVHERFYPLFDLPGLVFRDLSDRLNLSRDEGEKWIVNLIRETRMGADAKIDLEKVRCFATRGFSIVARCHAMPKPSRTIPTLGVLAPFLFGLGVCLGGWAVEESSPLDSCSAVGFSRPLLALAAQNVHGYPRFRFRSVFDYFWLSPCRSVV
jgi:hypothetical protein